MRRQLCNQPSSRIEYHLLEARHQRALARSLGEFRGANLGPCPGRPQLAARLDAGDPDSFDAGLDAGHLADWRHSQPRRPNALRACMAAAATYCRVLRPKLLHAAQGLSPKP